MYIAKLAVVGVFIGLLAGATMRIWLPIAQAVSAISQ